MYSQRGNAWHASSVVSSVCADVCLSYQAEDAVLVLCSGVTCVIQAMKCIVDDDDTSNEIILRETSFKVNQR